MMQGKQVRGLVLALSTITMGGLTALGQDPGAPPPPPPPAAGQPGGPWGGHRDPAQMEARHIEHLTKKLNLTPEQAGQVKLIDDAQRTQMLALRDDTSTPREEKRGKMIAMLQETQAKIRAVLTDEQKPKYDEMVAHEKRGMGRGHGGPNGRPDAPPPPPAGN
jgi:Spy/CpxP family protein refolding chaperone